MLQVTDLLTTLFTLSVLIWVRNIWKSLQAVQKLLNNLPSLEYEPSKSKENLCKGQIQAVRVRTRVQDSEVWRTNQWSVRCLVSTNQVLVRQSGKKSRLKNTLWNWTLWIRPSLSFSYFKRGANWVSTTPVSQIISDLPQDMWGIGTFTALLTLLSTLLEITKCKDELWCRIPVTNYQWANLNLPVWSTRKKISQTGKHKIELLQLGIYSVENLGFY